TLLCFTNLGNCCKVDLEVAQECRFRDKGVKFSSVCGFAAKNEYPVAMFAVYEDKLPEGYLLFFTKDGLIKKTEWKEYNLQKPYYQAIKLKDGDELISVEDDLPGFSITYITEGGMVLCSHKDDLPVQGRVAGGVKGIKLDEKDKIVFVSQTDDVGEYVVITDAGYYKRVIVSEVEPMGRYRKGVKIASLGKDDKVVFGGYVTEPYEIGVVDNFGVAFYVNTEDISIEPRTGKGKTLKSVNKKRKPETAHKIFGAFK
ncbi:MAG: DNA gyrase C-terminal beta-propeller domain-containing protein, partial [Clostridia bacterium]|nr:DNA gyrase C-terminal beta-propeller domain-containing protein [Clostridia bacterium]